MRRSAPRALAVLVAAVALIAPAAASAGAVLHVDDTRSLTIAAGLRASAGASAAGAPDGRSADAAVTGDTAIVGIRGTLSPALEVQLNLSRDPAGLAHVLDAIVEVDPAPVAKLWVGRFLPPTDRASSEGPFFSLLWDAPIAVRWPGQAGGRDDGAVAWGDLADGHVKYYAGAFAGRTGPGNPGAAPEWDGRVVVDLLDPEPGYYQAGTYLGARRVLALGAGGRSQKDGAGFVGGAGPIGSFRGWTADVFFESPVGGGFVPVVEGAFVRRDSAVADPMLIAGHGGWAIAGLLLPFSIAGGRVQPVARWEWFSPAGKSENVRTEAGIDFWAGGPGIRFSLVGSDSIDHSQPRRVRGVLLGAQLLL